MTSRLWRWKSCGPFFNDLLANGADAQHLGGLVDRQGRRRVVFDADGTREAYRQRAVVQSPDRPRVRRRAGQLAMPGHTGRKRGEVVRTRLVVQQAHTREWLGTFGESGNGKRWSRLERACEGVTGYLRSHGFAPDDGLMRMDGEFGWAHAALLLEQRGPGYLMRCSDYRLLDAPEAKAALAHAPQRFVQHDTGTERDAYEVGWVTWSSEVDGGKTISTRLVITAMRAPEQGEPKVGKRVGERVYELFVTNVTPEALTACDVLSLYFARGGFEQTLSEEDWEIEPDRWVSGHPEGQEFWQILAQLTWNLRLRLGLVAAPSKPRCTLWSEALPPCIELEPSATGDAAPPLAPVDDKPSLLHAFLAPSNAEAAATPAPGCLDAPDSPVPSGEASPAQIAPATPDAPSADPARPSSTAPVSPSAHGFVLQPDGTLLCPEHKVLRRAEVYRDRIRFRARDTDCQTCPRSAQCLRPNASGRRGRRVALPRAAVDIAPATHSGGNYAAKLDFLPRAAVDITPATPLTMASSRRRPVALPSNAVDLVPPIPPTVPRSTAPARPGPHPVYWIDLPATALRRTLPSLLAQQRVDGLPAVSTMLPPLAPLSRDQRAHRRLRWDERFARNARPASAPAIRLQLHGVPLPLAAYLGVPATG